MQLNSFLEDVIGITKPWRIISAEFDGVDTVDIELEYVKSQRPEAPDCPECGSSDTSYYDMVEKSWRHTDMCDQICMIHGMVPRVQCKSCGKVSRISNGVMEGFNSVLQAFKGRARGYCSFERYRTMIYLRSSGLC